MSGFRFDVPAQIHLGRGSRSAMMALGVALVAAFAPAQVAMAKTGPAAWVAPIEMGLTTAGEQKAVHASEIKRIQDERSAFSMGATQMANAYGLGTCFGGFLDNHKEQSAIEKSTVMILTKSADGQTLATGSGFVVRDSGAGTGHNALATARHVVNAADMDQLQTQIDMVKASASKAYPHMPLNKAVHKLLGQYLDKATMGLLGTDDWMTTPVEKLNSNKATALHLAFGIPLPDHIEAYASDGSFLGRFFTAATGQAGEQKTVFHDETAPTGIASNPADWAVLRLEATETDAKVTARFDGIEGLGLAPTQSPERSLGVSGDGIRPAVTQGYSGGPVVDAQGLVHGVVSELIQYPDVVTAPVQGMVSLRDHRAGASFDDARKTVDLPVRAPLVSNPLGDPRALEALGWSGRVKVTTEAPLYTGTLTMTLVGVPGGYCAASPTRQARISEAMPDLEGPKPGLAQPWEVKTMQDGSVRQFDSNGRLAALQRKDGSALLYEAGVLVALGRPDNTIVPLVASKAPPPTYRAHINEANSGWVTPVTDANSGWVAPVTDADHSQQASSTPFR